MRQLLLSLLINIAWINVSAQGEKLPIIDIHLHAQDAIWSKTMVCSPQPCTGARTQIRKLSELLPRTVEEMKKNNVVLGVVTWDDLGKIYKWDAYDPELFLTGVAVWDPNEPDISFIEKELKEGRLDIVGEIATQYEGYAPNDLELDNFYKLAVKFDVPLLIHCGALAGQSEAYNVVDGNPLLIEPVIKKYPNLRIWIENASYPFSQEIIALMNRYSNVYTDVSTITWLIPRAEFHSYLEKLVTAGLGKRIMFGSDQMIWPEAIGLGIDAVESANFLTLDQKRDILYNNAARFLRLSEDEIAKHHKTAASR